MTFWRPVPPGSRTRLGTAFGLLLLLSAACAGTPRVPWGDASPQTRDEPHADVRTLNPDYQRTRSQVLVREISRPTRAALDYAAYHANFMIADAAPERPAAAQLEPRFEQIFEDRIERATLTADIAHTPLTASERHRPLAFAPLSEYLLAHKTPGAQALAELGSAVRSETWGLPATAGLASQSVSEIYLHGGAGKPQLWLKIEFAPWFKALGVLPDQDRDGYPEVYARARSELTSELVAQIEREYAARVLEPAEVKAWANQLASYWYPSFNTDLVPADEHWPDAHTESGIKRELGELSLAAPLIVMRGKPEGQACYNVFVVRAAPAASGGARPVAATPALVASRPSPAPGVAAARVREELARDGAGSWEAWTAKLAPFRAAIRKRLDATPSRVKALPGRDGFLFFRNSLEFVIGGDLERQPPGKNPLPIIVAWKEQLEKLGVDFLFVPVPAKIEIFPDAFDAHFSALAGEIVNPAMRKFVASLAASGVEVFDLHAPLLAARRAAEQPGEEPLYQRQDTHWSARGLELSAQLLAARVKQYPWYAQLERHGQSYGTREASVTRFGDLHSRLAESQKKAHQPENLRANQVVRADGSLYDDDPDSPIVVLGDSFTGVYELTEVEHAGLSAHLARNVSYPVDLVMSYGGGPNVRTKLLRRGAAALAQKKLVIWVMADRDLYNYWEDWQPVEP